MSADALLALIGKQDMMKLSAVDEISIRAASYDPPTWQAIIKRRDKTKPWGVGVHADPAEALRLAYGRLANDLRDPAPPKTARTRQRPAAAPPAPAPTVRTRTRIRP